jgi:putative DNA primase/helicase
MPRKPKKVIPKKSKPLAKVASSIKAEKTDWVWDGRIAKGRVTVIAGDPGIGKSQIAVTLAAKVSTGGKWPNGEGSAPEGDVVMLIGEDDLATRIKPLLMAADADVKRVHLIGNDGVDHKPINLFDAEDHDAIAGALAQAKNPQLLIIDPITAFADYRLNNGAAARQLLAELTRGAESWGIAVVLICHLTKGGGRNALAMISGSSAIAAAARAIYLATNGEPGSKWHILACVKNNLARTNLALRYCIKPEEVAGGVATTRIVWHKEPLRMTADEALAKAKVNSVKPTRPVEELLKGLLADGKRAASEVLARGEQSGFTPKQLRTAAKHLGVQHPNTGGPETKKWFWELPAPAKKPG